MALVEKKIKSSVKVLMLNLVLFLFLFSSDNANTMSNIEAWIHGLSSRQEQSAGTPTSTISTGNSLR